MKRSAPGIVIALIFAAAFLIIPANQIQASVSDNGDQVNLQEDLLKYKYPYSELLPGERAELATYEINVLNEQIADFHPGQGTTLSYLENAIANLQQLLPASSPVYFDSTAVTASSSSTVNAPVAINMIYYGSNGGGADQRIISAHPEFLVDNSPAGPEDGDANISEYMSAGIKYFEYLDGGYEGTASRTIPNDLRSNLNYITAAAQTGAYGIFLDEVSDYPNAASLSYLQQIYNQAHSLGLKVVFNTGEASWSGELMKYCDYMNSSETWNNNTLTESQNKYANRVWLETQGVSDATTATKLTENAWGNGIKAEYACDEYTALPDWLESYVTQIRSYSTLNLSFIVYVAAGMGVALLVAMFLVLRKRPPGG